MHPCHHAQIVVKNLQGPSLPKHLLKELAFSVQDGVFLSQNGQPGVIQIAIAHVYGPFAGSM